MRLSDLTKVLSLVDGIDAAAINPLLARIPPELKARGMEVTMPHFVAALRTRNTRPGATNYLRIMLRAREQQIGGREIQLIEKVESSCPRVLSRHRRHAGSRSHRLLRAADQFDHQCAARPMDLFCRRHVRRRHHDDTGLPQRACWR